jgi:hypothetical protein
MMNPLTLFVSGIGCWLAAGILFRVCVAVRQWQ